MSDVHPAARPAPDFDLLAADDCPLCGHRSTLVVPDYCSEGHGTDCPDRMCVHCGSALFVGPAPAEEPVRRQRLA